MVGREIREEVAAEAGAEEAEEAEEQQHWEDRGVVGSPAWLAGEVCWS